MLDPLEVAVAQPVCHPDRIDLDAAAHAAAVRATSASLVVFPELSLTGYVLDADEVDVAGGALDAVEACAATGATALVGAPVRVDGGRRIAVIAVTAAVAAAAAVGAGRASAQDPTLSGPLFDARLSA